MNDRMKLNENDSSLLELAAKNDAEGFKRLIDGSSSAINDLGLWYGRQRSTKRMLMEHRTPLMIAATYGSLDVVKFILSLSETDVNRSCGTDKTTALHCAASSGLANAFEVIQLLLVSGGDVGLVDANGFRPADVIFVPVNLLRLKSALEKLLQNEKKEYPIDPFFPDLNSDSFSSDEFRMFAFKIRPCSRAYSHDWTECPFIHPGESARRRDPRKIHYSCVPCPDYKKGQCRFGDFCEFAHGVFECWLHPAQYRTRLCKDGTFCSRRVCFFAHTNEQLRPLYVSTRSSLASPRGSPVSASPISPLPFSPPPPPPMLQLHGSSFQASQMRLSFNARNVHTEEVNRLIDLEIHQRQQMLALSQFSPTNQYSPKGFYGMLSPRIMSPKGLEQTHSTPFSPQHSTKGTIDWSVDGSEAVRTTRFQSTKPDVSWVQPLVKEPPQPGADHSTSLGALLENMHLDHIVA